MQFTQEDLTLNNFHSIIIFISVVHGSYSNRTDPHCVRELKNRVQKDSVFPKSFKLIIPLHSGHSLRTYSKEKSCLLIYFA